MTAYFDQLDSLISYCGQSLPNEAEFLAAVDLVELHAVAIIKLSLLCPWYPVGLRELIEEALITYSVRNEGARLRTLLLRRSTLLSHLHSFYHEVARETADGPRRLSDDPLDILKTWVHYLNGEANGAISGDRSILED